MKRLRLAIIGIGTASEPHAKSLVDLAGSIEVVAAVSRNPARREAFAKRFGFPVSDDPASVIADRSIDAALVLTPPNAHLEVASACFEAGKHVLIEKPLDMSVERGTRMVALARKAGRTLGVVLQHRFRPGSKRLREILEAGGLGAIVSASMNVPWWRPQSYYDEPGRGTYARDGGGVMITQAIHTFDLFRSLVGVSAVTAATAMTTPLHRMESEDHVMAMLRLGNGAPGSLLATSAQFPGGPERIEILGDKGSASLVGGTLDVTWLDGRKEAVAAEGGTGAGANVMDFPHDAHRDLIADFVAAVSEGRDPRVSGEEALETQRWLDAILIAGGARKTGQV